MLPCALGFTQPLAEVSTRNRKIMSLWSRARPVRKADNITALCLDCLDNVGSLTSHNPRGLHGLLWGELYFLTCEASESVSKGIGQRSDLCATIKQKRLTDCGKIVSPTHRPRFSPWKHYFSATGTNFCRTLSKPQGLVRPEGLGKLEKFHSPHRVSNPRPYGL
jgi:hypothetical protein